MDKDNSIYSINGYMTIVVQAFCDVFEEFFKDMFDALVKDLPQISLNMEEK